MGELFLYAFQDISQVSIADVLKIRLVVDIEELQFVSDNADADDDPSTAALTTAFRCDGKAHLAGATIQLNALHGILKQRSEQLLKILLQRLVAFLQPLVGGAEILRHSYLHKARSAAMASS